MGDERVAGVADSGGAVEHRAASPQQLGVAGQVGAGGTEERRGLLEGDGSLTGLDGAHERDLEGDVGQGHRAPALQHPAGAEQLGTGREPRPSAAGVDRFDLEAAPGPEWAGVEGVLSCHRIKHRKNISSFGMRERRSNQERSRSTRAQLVKAAWRLFAEQGFAATSITQVASQAQLSTGALYHHWSTKQELFAAVAAALHHKLALEISNSAPEGGSPLARFEHAASVFLRRCRDRDVGRILLLDGPAILGSLWEELDQRWWLGPTEDLLRQAIDDGELVAADPRLLATALLGSLTALGRTIATHPDAVAHRAAELVLHSLTDGLRAG